MKSRLNRNLLGYFQTNCRQLRSKTDRDNSEPSRCNGHSFVSQYGASSNLLTTKPKGKYFIDRLDGKAFFAFGAKDDSKSSPARDTDTRHSFLDPSWSNLLKHRIRIGGSRQIFRDLRAFLFVLHWGQCHKSARSSSLQNSSKHCFKVALGFEGMGRSIKKKLSNVFEAKEHDLQVMVDSSWPMSASVKTEVWASTASFHCRQLCSSRESFGATFSDSFTMILIGVLPGVVTTLELDCWFTFKVFRECSFGAGSFFWGMSSELSRKSSDCTLSDLLTDAYLLSSRPNSSIKKSKNSWASSWVVRLNFDWRLAMKSLSSSASRIFPLKA